MNKDLDAPLKHDVEKLGIVSLLDEDNSRLQVNALTVGAAPGNWSVCKVSLTGQT